MSLADEREVVVEQLQRTVAQQQVDLTDRSRLSSSLQSSLLQLQDVLKQRDDQVKQRDDLLLKREELLAVERARVQKLELEMAQHKDGSFLRSIVQELLSKVNSQSISKADMLADLNRAVQDLRYSLMPHSTSPSPNLWKGVDSDLYTERLGNDRSQNGDIGVNLYRDETVPETDSNSPFGATKLREWIVQLNAFKSQNQQLHSKLEATLGELEDRNNQIEELQEQLSASHDQRIEQSKIPNGHITPEEGGMIKQQLQEKEAALASVRSDYSQLKSKMKGYGVMLEELVHRGKQLSTDSSNKGLPDLEPLIEDLVRVQMNSISVDDHEDILASKLSQLEQQMYTECRDLLHSLEERKNNEYTQAIGAVRVGVKKLEDTLEEERERANKTLSEITQELEEERAKSLSLARDLTSSISKALTTENASTTKDATGKVTNTVSARLSALQGSLATTLEHTYRSHNTTNTNANQHKHVMQTVESALNSNFHSINDLILSAQSETTLKCAEIEKKFRQKQDKQTNEFSQFKAISTTMQANNQRTLQQLRSRLSIGVSALRSELSLLKSVVQRDMASINQFASTSLMKYQLTVQTVVTHTEEQQSRVGLRESKLKTSIASLEHKMSQLAQKNEQLAEKNTHLEEKNTSYKMEIESLREESEVRVQETTRLRAECNEASQALVVISARLDQAHNELQLVTSSMAPVFGVMFGKKSPHKRPHSRQKAYHQRPRSTTPDKLIHNSPGGGSFGGEAGNGWGGGVDSDPDSDEVGWVESGNSAQQLLDNVVTFVKTLQEERKQGDQDHRELHQQITNMLQINSVLASHHHELVTLICDALPESTSVSPDLLQVADSTSSVSASNSAMVAAALRNSVGLARPQLVSLRNILNGLVQSRDDIQSQIQGSKMERATVARECDDLRKQLKDSKAERLAVARDLDIAKQQLQDQQMALGKAKVEKLGLLQNIEEQRLQIQELNSGKQGVAGQMDTLRYQLQDTQASVAQITTEKNTLTRNFEEVRVQLQSEKEGKHALVVEIQDKKHQLEELHSALGEYKLENETLTKKVQEMRLQTHELKETKQVKDSEVETLDQQLKDTLVVLDRTTKDKNTLTQSNEELRVQLKELNSVRIAMQSEVEILQRQLKDSQSSLVLAVNEKSSLAAKVEELRKEIKLLTNTKQATARDTAELNLKLQEAEASLIQLKADKAGLAASAEHLREQLQNIAIAKETLEHEANELHSRANEAKVERERTAREFEELKQHLKELHARVGKDSVHFTQEADGLRNQIKHLQAGKSAATRESDELKQYVKDLNSKVEKTEHEKRELFEQVKELRIVNEKESERKDGALQEVNGLRQKLKELNSQIKKSSTEKAELSREYDDLDQQLKESQLRGSTISRDNDHLKQQLSDSQLQLHEAQVSVSAVTRDLDECRDSLKETQRQLKEQRVGSTTASQELASIQEQYSKLQRQYADSKKEKRVITSQHTQAQEQITQLSSEHTTLLHECNELKLLIKDLQGKWDDAKNQLAQWQSRARADKEAKNATERELGKVKNSLVDHENKKHMFLDKVHAKDREIAQLHALLEKSFKEVTVEGIMTASQLEAKTKELATKNKTNSLRVVATKSSHHRHHKSTSNNENGGGDFRLHRVDDAIDDLSSIDKRSDSNPRE